MTEVLEKPKTDVDAIRDGVNRTIQLRDLKQAAVARESGVSTAALSRFLAGRYEGDNEAVATKLFAWMDGVSKKDSVPAPLMRGHAFVSTSASNKIVTGLDLAQFTRDLVMVYGEPGVGKTVTLENYQQTGSNVWLATMSPDTSGKVPMLEELGLALGLTLTGGAASMRRQIVARVRNTNGLIVVDEAQHLDGKALDELRCIHDKAKIGMVLCGNPLVKARVEMLDQVNSRVGKKVKLGRPSRPDVAVLAAQFEVTGRDEVGFLHTISQLPGGLRCVVKTVRLALLSAAGEGSGLTSRHIASAWSELALEDRV